MSLIEVLATFATEILCHTRLESLEYIADARCFEAYLSREDLRLGETNANLRRVRARSVVFATGRFGPNLQAISRLKVKTVFRRLEYGVRIVVDSSNAFFSLSSIATLKDPKILISDPSEAPKKRVEWRSFCCCRDGEVIKTKFDGICAFSGRADSQPSGESNIGFNTRILDEAIAREALPTLRDLPPPFRISLSRALSGEQKVPFTEAASRYLLQGLARLVEEYPALASADLVGPTIEGVGGYLDHDELRVKTEGQGSIPLWVCGDSCGTFRGLLPAIVSGIYVGKMIHKHMQNQGEIS